MQIEIDKQLLLETIGNIQRLKNDNIFYVYHVGVKGYKDIRPIALLGNAGKSKIKDLIKKGYSINYIDNYKHEVNAFPGYITFNMLNDLKNAGFDVYSNISNLYVYKINILDPENINNIKMTDITSTPQQLKFDNKNWPSFIKKNKDLDDENFFKEKAKYMSKREDYLKSQGIHKTSDVRRLIDNPLMKEWSNTPKWFKYNITHGNKKQYASCIPHLQFTVTKPLKFESVTKLSKII